MHDDVMIRDLYWEERMNEAFLKYDLFGVIGAKSCNLKLNVDANRLAWCDFAPETDHIGENGEISGFIITFFQ